MALLPADQFPGKIKAPSPAYPYGEAQNVSTPGDGTGTPFVAALVNDLFGFQQALLQEAEITPNNTPDTATASQYLEALKAIFGLKTASFACGGELGSAVAYAVKLGPLVNITVPQFSPPSSDWQYSSASGVVPAEFRPESSAGVTSVAFFNSSQYKRIVRLTGTGNIVVESMDETGQFNLPPNATVETSTFTFIRPSDWPA